MPRTKETLRIDVSENAAEDMRVITVTIVAPASKFMLADLLRKRGAVANLDATLKQAAREAVQNYLAGTEELIAALAAGHKRSGNGASPKIKIHAQEGGAGAQNGSSKGAAAVPEEENSGDVLSLE